MHLDFYDYNERIDGSTFLNKDFFSNPQWFQSCFMNYASCGDIFIAGHYYGKDSPYLFTREDAKSPDFKIRTIADISVISMVQLLLQLDHLPLQIQFMVITLKLNLKMTSIKMKLLQ